MRAKRRTWARCILAVLALSVLAGAPDAVAVVARPHNLIFMVPDGCGPASFSLARAVDGRPLALDSIAVGSCTTASLDSRITDSAAAATAYSTGVATGNGAIAVDAAERPLGTLFEAAEARGMATGIIVTCRLTHATPAAFVSHVPKRSQEAEIALQMLEHGLEVALGGGRREFIPRTAGGRRVDGRDLLGEAARRGVRVVADPAALAAVMRPPVLGLFADSDMQYGLDRDPARQPSLADMTRKALELLRGDADGFVLVIEGSRIDHAAHDHDVATHARELLAFDDAARVALDFARQDHRTLVVSVADHETGGLTLGRAGEDHGGWAAEAVRRVRASAAAMAQRVEDGADAARVVAEATGIEDLTAAEIDTLQVARGRNSLLAAIVAPVNRRSGIGWSTSGHTGIDVGVYASGPGADAFRGEHTNVEIGRALAKALRLDPAAVTRELRQASMPVPR